MRGDPPDVAPVGASYEIVHGDQRAVVTESGATLRAYQVGSRPVIEAFDGPDTVPIGCQGEVLAPWPNRIVDGRWTWEGASYQLWLTEPERGHALHGLVRTVTWSAVSHERDRVELETRLLAHPGWPFPLHFVATYALGRKGLVCGLTASNIGRRPCPYGAAAHPYLAIPGGTVDDAIVRIPAATWLATDDRLAPTERRATQGTTRQFSETAPVGARKADNAFTGLDRRPGGDVEASVTAPDGRTAVVWGDSSVKWFQLFTGDTLPPSWRRRTLALEPMTCGPDALNTRDDLVILEPGESHTMTWGLALR